MSSMAKRPDNLGVRDGKLAACPDTPNCVSTQAGDTLHAIEPFRFAGSPAHAMQQLRTLVEAQPRATIVTAANDYLHVAFRSLVFRFVDDVEFFVDADERVVHFRSASRVGHSDLGANRRRMESLRTKFEQQPAESAAKGPVAR